MTRYVMILLLLSSCSTILEGRSQQIAVNTHPSGADCELTRKGEKIGSVNNTPASVTIEKTKDDITVTCNKSGYEPSTYIDHSGAAGATGANVLMGLGGFIGWGVDSATGSDNKYDTPVNLVLSKK